MKKILRALCAGTMLISMVSCHRDEVPTSSSSNYSSSSVASTVSGGASSLEGSSEGGGSDVGPTITGTPDIVRIHYANEEASYNGLVFWFWSKGYKPEAETEKTGTDDFGIYVDVDMKNFTAKSETSLFFLVKKAGTWDYKTCDNEIVFNKYNMQMEDNKKVLVVYATALTKNNIELAKEYDPNAGKVKICNFSATNKISLTANKAMASYKLYALTSNYFVKGDDVEPYLVANGTLSKDTEEITLPSTFTFDTTISYRITVSFEGDAKTSTKNVDTSYLYSNNLVTLPVYNGNDLGLTFDSQGIPVFKVYAPTSTVVQVKIYKYGHGSLNATDDERKNSYLMNLLDKPSFTITLNKGENGIYTSEGECDGWDKTTKMIVSGSENYYTLNVINQLGEHECLDPYANVASINGERALIKSINDTKMVPEDWASLPLKWDGVQGFDITSPTELVVSEQHIRDLTMSDTWTSNEEAKKLRGTYKGFYESGTTYTKGDKTVKTGFDHLEEYGVNAIQLQPIYDQANDEAKDEFNWGYNPQNYNVVEGQYSSNPYDAYARVYELRELVAKYANNKNHARIIMDVVYNHMSNASTSSFEYLVPGYYFRQDKEGNLLNASGCGNEVKTEAPMMRKYIVDSLVHWATNYKIKGFRFDLMGIIDAQTLKLAKETLYEIDPDIVIYGEGWDATGAYSSNDNFANTGTVYKSLYHSSTSKGSVGGFNDCARNALKGENSQGSSSFYGFISQGENDLGRDKVEKVAAMMKGSNKDKGNNPVQTVNYASCHDNYTLFDQLNYTLSSDGGVTEPEIQTVARASVAVNGLVILSNGISFINGGEEIFRTKVETNEANKKNCSTMYGKLICHNSYNTTDSVNAYDYSRKVDLLDYYNQYRALIAIKKELLPLSSSDVSNSQKIDTWDTTSGTKLSTFRVAKNGYKYHFFFNGRSSSANFGFDSSKGSQRFTNGTTFTKISTGLNTSSKYALAVYVIQ